MYSEMLPYKKILLHVAASFSLSAFNLVKTKKLEITHVLARAQLRNFFYRVGLELERKGCYRKAKLNS